MHPTTVRNQVKQVSRLSLYVLQAAARMCARTDTRLKNHMSSMVSLIIQSGCGILPVKALWRRKRHGWVLARPPCYNTERFKNLVPLKVKHGSPHFGTLAWILRPKSASLTCTSHFVGHASVTSHPEPPKTGKSGWPRICVFFDLGGNFLHMLFYLSKYVPN